MQAAAVDLRAGNQNDAELRPTSACLDVLFFGGAVHAILLLLFTTLITSSVFLR